MNHMISLSPIVYHDVTLKSVFNFFSNLERRALLNCDICMTSQPRYDRVSRG